MPALTSIVEVRRITSLEDPVKRNFQITQSYHELSLLMTKRTGLCANWCTFATWASKQAGQTIRREDLAKAIENSLKTEPDLAGSVARIFESALVRSSRLTLKGVTKLIWETIDPSAAARRASVAVAKGNQKVYAEIGLEFARFMETCLDDETFDAANIAGFCESLRPGDPPEGQRYLRQAFSRYYRAFFEKDPKVKSELMLLANIEIGFHEQTRLQPEIAAALESSVEDPHVLKRRLLDALFPGAGWIDRIGSWFRELTGRPTPSDRAIQHFTVLARHHVRLFLTKRLMELGFPKGVRLRLGKDLVAKYPSTLQHLSNPDLLALLKQIDPTPDSTAQTAAIDWADLPDRLHFIADLFRCYQEEKSLLEEPFKGG